jgi:hypothetical protein
VRLGENRLKAKIVGLIRLSVFREFIELKRLGGGRANAF